MKVLLIVPNFRWANWDKNSLWNFIPHNLCLLASMIREICDVEIIDANLNNLSYKQLKNEIIDYNPDVVGITILMDQYGPAGHKTAKLTKEINKSIITVFGGIYATTNSDYVIKDKSVDFVVIGEGEYVLRDLILYFKGSGNLPKNGIAYKHNNKVINLGHSDFIMDLDKLPIPAYDLIDLKKYIYTTERKTVDFPPEVPYMRIFSSRGCPIGCSFCQVRDIMGLRFRMRSPEHVLNEIKYLINNYGIKSIEFDDDNLITDRQRAIDIFKGLKELNISWVVNALAAFKLDKELFTIMRDCGCVYVDIAIESASERILKDIIGKPVKLDKVREVAAWARELGVFIACNFMIGFPTETWDEIRKTIRFAEEINIDYAKIFIVIPLRNTKLFDMCEKGKHFKKGFKYKDIGWCIGQLESDEYSSDDLTILRAFEWDRINFSSEAKIQKVLDRMKIPREELEDMRKFTRKNVIQTIIREDERRKSLRKF